MHKHTNTLLHWNISLNLKKIYQEHRTVICKCINMHIFINLYSASVIKFITHSNTCTLFLSLVPFLMMKHLTFPLNTHVRSYPLCLLLNTSNGFLLWCFQCETGAYMCLNNASSKSLPFNKL